MSAPPDPFTQLLHAAHAGDSAAAATLYRLVRQQLREIAVTRLNGTFAPLLPSPSSLVHETFARLILHPNGRPPADGNEFFRWASRVMADLLIERRRRETAQRRGGGWVRVSLEAIRVEDHPAHGVDAVVGLLDLGEQLEWLRSKQPLVADVLVLRYFEGLTFAEIAAKVGKPMTTVQTRHALGLRMLERRLPGYAHED